MIFGLELATDSRTSSTGLFHGFSGGAAGHRRRDADGAFMTFILSHHGVDSSLAVKMAIATSMATIMFTSLSSIRAHHSHGAIRWDLVRSLAPGITVMALITGAFIYPMVKGAALALIFALFVGFSATQMLRSKKNARLAADARHGGTPRGGWRDRHGLGFGGRRRGFISVPFMTTWCNVAMHNAVATSAALGFPIAVASTAGNIIGGWSVPNSLPGSVGYLWVPVFCHCVSQRARRSAGCEGGARDETLRN